MPAQLLIKTVKTVPIQTIQCVLNAKLASILTMRQHVQLVQAVVQNVQLKIHVQNVKINTHFQETVLNRHAWPV